MKRVVIKPKTNKRIQIEARLVIVPKLGLVESANSFGVSWGVMIDDL